MWTAPEMSNTSQYRQEEKKGDLTGILDVGDKKLNVNASKFSIDLISENMDRLSFDEHSKVSNVDHTNRKLYDDTTQGLNNINKQGSDLYTLTDKADFGSSLQILCPEPPPLSNHSQFDSNRLKNQPTLATPHTIQGYSQTLASSMTTHSKQSYPFSPQLDEIDAFHKYNGHPPTHSSGSKSMMSSYGGLSMSSTPKTTVSSTSKSGKQQQQTRSAEPIDGYIYQVQFKRAHRNFILAPSAPRNIIPGDFVKVEADRGEDMGIVLAKIPVTEFEEVIPTAGYRGRGFSSGQGERKFLYRLATPDERASLAEKVEDEERALETIREKSAERGLPMVILDAEYQYDRHKLTFFFEADRRIDFRELVSELFSQYKTRIWMQQVDTSVLGMHDAGTELAKATGFLPIRDETNNSNNNHNTNTTSAYPYPQSPHHPQHAGLLGNNSSVMTNNNLLMQQQQQPLTSPYSPRNPPPNSLMSSNSGGINSSNYSPNSFNSTSSSYLLHTGSSSGGSASSLSANKYVSPLSTSNTSGFAFNVQAATYVPTTQRNNANVGNAMLSPTYNSVNSINSNTINHPHINNSSVGGTTSSNNSNNNNNMTNLNDMSGAMSQQFLDGSWAFGR